MSTLEQLIYGLDEASFDPEARPERTALELLREILFLGEERFWQYTPTQLRHFDSRLLRWLQNREYVAEELRGLLELVPAIQFVDRDDMAALYRSAFRGPIARWLANDCAWSIEQLFDPTPATFDDALTETWFCPVTDSMDIGQFLRVNQLGGASSRPPWKVLATFGDFSKVRKTISERGYRRLVLLEDFVGSGTQAGGAVLLALRELENLPILFVPLIASQQGVKKYSSFTNRYAHFSFEPVFTIPTRMHVFKEAQAGEPDLFGILRQIAATTFAAVQQHQRGDNEQPTHPLGFSGDYGLLFVQHTNCPNNTIPFIWRDGHAWSGLFPRVSR
jgi:hypothetical protein